MTHYIRALHPTTDRGSVTQLMRDVTDYIRVERGEDPTPALTDEFFTDAPPGIDPATSARLGLFRASGRLIGIADLSFGYPARGDAFLGLILIAPDARGGGLGHAFVAHIEAAARARGATYLYLAALDANDRGRAFWRREGFGVRIPFRKVTLGPKTQFASRLGKALR